MNPWRDGPTRTRIAEVIDRVLGDDNDARKKLAIHLVPKAALSLVPNASPLQRTTEILDLIATHTNAPLQDLQNVLSQMRPQRRTEIDRALDPITLWLACTADGLAVQLETIEGEADRFEFSGRVGARVGGAVDHWRRARAPKCTLASRLPAVLHLLVHASGGGFELTEARFCRLGQPPVPLAAPEAPPRPGLPPGRAAQATDVDGLARLARVLFLRQIQARGLCADSRAVVLVVEGEPTAELCALYQQKNERGRELGGWFQAVALWPVVGGERARGEAHDGPFDSPADTGRWRVCAGGFRSKDGAEPIGLWAGTWAATAECPVVGGHDRRWFSVLGTRKNIRELARRTHGAGPATLDQLFAAVGSAAPLLWTDHRLLYEHDGASP